MGSSAQSKGIRIYRFLASRGWPRSYVGKIMLVAFLGTHVPLLALLGHFLLTETLSRPLALEAFWVALAATLAGTGATLFALSNLLQPIRITCQALRDYLSAHTFPELPTQFTDEAGQLMADTQQALTKLDTVIRQLSYYDDLTGLPNRAMFEDRVRQAVADSIRHGGAVAVLVLDVVGLANINEVFGRASGDLVLQGIADRLGKQVSETDAIARVGGDEFALLQTKSTSPDALAALAQRLLHAVGSQPFSVMGRTIDARVAVGIATHPQEDGRPEDLLRDAEAARHQARVQPTSIGFSFYSAKTNALLRRSLQVEAFLRGALGRGELELHYQPQIDNHTGRIIGIEALMRWEHPVLGQVSPSEFIPIAERSDIILSIGEWALRTACLQNKAWQDDGFAPIRIAVNLSARQFQQPDLVERVALILAESRLESRWLELEVTESVAMEGAALSIATLKRLRNLGVTLSLDDFGTGYSSLSHLSRLPIDTLKIDRSFIRDITDNEENASITRSIIALARSLHLHVIAEGVETKAQYEFLRTSGCGLSQGFFFSRPVSAQHVESLVRDSADLRLDCISSSVAVPAPAVHSLFVNMI